MTRSQPPVPAKKPHQHTEHGAVRADPWFWLHDTTSSEVVAHLSAERAFYDASCAHLHSLVSTLGSEMAGRLPSVERSPTWQRVRFVYYTEHLAGSEYAVLRRRNAPSIPDSETISGSNQDFADDFRSETLLDLGSLADGSGYLDLGVSLVSPDEDLLAYSVDTVGDEVYRLRFRDLRSGADLAEEIPRSYYGGAWSADSAHFFYTVHDHAYRPHQVWRHRLGTSPDLDVLVLEEADEAFALHLRGSRSGDLVIVLSESRSTGETWVIDAHDPGGRPAVGRWPAGRGGLPRRARGGRSPAGRHQRRRPGAAADGGPAPRRRRAGRHGVERAASRGPRRASRAGRCVRAPMSC